MGTTSTARCRARLLYFSYIVPPSAKGADERRHQVKRNTPRPFRRPLETAPVLRAFLGKLADMSALFRPSRNSSTPEDWTKIADRRSSPTEMRLRAGLFLRYQGATQATEHDIFQRDAKTWALFEHAVLPELANFTFVDKSRDIFVSPSAVLADGMFHLWTVTELGLDPAGRPTTLAVISELANYLCTIYETTHVDRRKRRRNWLGLGRRS